MSQIRKTAAILLLILVPLAAWFCWSAGPAAQAGAAEGVELRQLLEYRGEAAAPAPADAEPLNNWQNTGVSVTIWR